MQETTVLILDSLRRIETRMCWQSTDVAWFADAPLWEGLRSFALIGRTREFPDGRRESARQLYLTSRTSEPLKRWSLNVQR